MRERILMLVVTLVVIAQACCCIRLGCPQPPHTITPSDEAVQRLEQRLDIMATPGPDGTFTFTITEEEITSLVAKQFAEHQQRGEAMPITAPQIYFRNGRVEVYTTLQLSDRVAVPGMIALSITIENNRPVFTIEEIDVGPFPVPAALLEELTNQMNQILSKSLGGDSTLITGIQIGEGEMTITVQPPTGN